MRYAGKHVTCERRMNDELSFLAQCCFVALVQRISSCGKTNTVLTPDKVQNVLMYGSRRFDEIQMLKNMLIGRNGE